MQRPVIHLDLYFQFHKSPWKLQPGWLSHSKACSITSTKLQKQASLSRLLLKQEDASQIHFHAKLVDKYYIREDKGGFFGFNLDV